MTNGNNNDTRDITTEDVLGVGASADTWTPTPPARLGKCRSRRIF